MRYKNTITTDNIYSAKLMSVSDIYRIQLFFFYVLRQNKCRFRHQKCKKEENQMHSDQRKRKILLLISVLYCTVVDKYFAYLNLQNIYWNSFLFIFSNAFRSMKAQEHSSLMVTVANLKSGIYHGPGVEPASGHLVFCVLSASETGLLLVVKLGRNVVMMRASK